MCLAHREVDVADPIQEPGARVFVSTKFFVIRLVHTRRRISRSDIQHSSFAPCPNDRLPSRDMRPVYEPTFQMSTRSDPLIWTKNTISNVIKYNT